VALGGDVYARIYRLRREVMNKKSPCCIDCLCEEFTQSERYRGRHLMTRDIFFSCGAHQREFQDSESNLGRVEFEGCNCEL
jgi:hypothetical protein